jgi:hypothetical protein
MAQLGEPGVAQGILPATAAGVTSLGQGDSLALTLADQRAF